MKRPFSIPSIPTVWTSAKSPSALGGHRDACAELRPSGLPDNFDMAEAAVPTARLIFFSSAGQFVNKVIDVDLVWSAVSTAKRRPSELTSNRGEARFEGFGLRLDGSVLLQCLRLGGCQQTIEAPQNCGRRND